MRTVRLYNPRQDATLTTVVQSARVRLFTDEGGQQEAASVTTGPVSVSGTDVTFADVPARLVGIEFLDVTGSTRSMRVASLAEVEVIARVDSGGTCAIPGAPGTLAATVSGSTVSLSWTSPSVGAPQGYVVEAGSAPGRADLATVPLTAGVTTFSTAAPNGRYVVRVRAVNACGTGAASNEVVVDVPGACANPATPSLTTSVAGPNVTVSWTPVAGAVGYRLEAGSVAGVTDLFVGTFATTGLTAAPPPGRYYVRVRALAACGAASPPSADAVVVVP